VPKQKFQIFTGFMICTVTLVHTYTYADLLLWLTHLMNFSSQAEWNLTLNTGTVVPALVLG